MHILGFTARSNTKQIWKIHAIIFMEWVNLPYNLESCPEFKQWVKNFYLGGYIPTYAR